MPVTDADQLEAPEFLVDSTGLADADDALEHDAVLDTSLFEEEDEDEEQDDAVELVPAPSEADELEELRRGRWRGKSDKSPQTPLETYLREINETSLLSAADERELAARIAQGDAEARDRMVRANLRLVVNIARGYSGKGLGLQDLIEEGNLGLLRAVEGFDPNMGTRFSTYASYWIKQSIKRALINSSKTIRIPAYMVELLSKWRRANAPERGIGTHADPRGDCPRAGPAQEKAADHQKGHPHLQFDAADRPGRNRLVTG